MDHVAIMNKKWKLIPKIISGEKYIESRWYKTKRAPWNKIKIGDTIYFKNSGEFVTVKAEVYKVLQFDQLNNEKMRTILKDYGKGIGMSYENSSEWLFGKKYCILLFLKNPKVLKKPFGINKEGFGISSAWLICKDIKDIATKL